MKTFRLSMPSALRTGLLTTALALLGWAATAQTISGKVFNECTGQPIAGAEVNISVNLPGQAGGNWNITTQVNGSWNFSFFGSDPNGPYIITVLGGASSPGSYIYFRTQGNNNGMNFDLLQKIWEFNLNGEEVSWQNNSQSPHTLCSNVDNCLNLVPIEGYDAFSLKNYCYRVSLYTVGTGGTQGTLLAESSCTNFNRLTLDPCDRESFYLNDLFGQTEVLPPIIRLEVQQFCCESGCEPGEGVLVNTEVVFIEVLNNIDFGFQFLAGDYVDELHGPPGPLATDGLIPGSTQLPGPFVGAGTVGLNISEFSDNANVTSWQYSIEEVDCVSGNTTAVLYGSPVFNDPLPSAETFLDKFIGLPGQETQAYFPFGTGLLGGNYTAGKCYKVTVGANTICGGAEVFSYFQIQQTDEDLNPCTFCLLAPPDDLAAAAAEAAVTVGVAPNPASNKTTVSVVANAEALAGLSLYDLGGREIMAVFRGGLGAGRTDIPLDLSVLAPGLYLLKGQVGGQAVAEKIIVL